MFFGKTEENPPSCVFMRFEKISNKNMILFNFCSRLVVVAKSAQWFHAHRPLRLFCHAIAVVKRLWPAAGQECCVSSSMSCG